MKTNSALLHLAISDAPLSTTDAAKLRDEACRLTHHVSRTTDKSLRRERISDVRDLIRRLDPATDPLVAEIVEWLARVDPLPTPAPEQEHQGPRVIFRQKTGSELREELDRMQEEQERTARASKKAALLTRLLAGNDEGSRRLEDARGAHAAQVVAAATARERLEAAIASEDEAKRVAGETDTDEAWAARREAGQRALEARERSEAADAKAARLEAALADIEQAIFAEGYERARASVAHDALRAALGDAPQMRRTIDLLSKDLDQRVRRVAWEMHTAAVEGNELAPFLDAPGAPIPAHTMHGIITLIEQLAAAESDAAPAQVAAE